MNNWRCHGMKHKFCMPRRQVPRAEYSGWSWKWEWEWKSRSSEVLNYPEIFIAMCSILSLRPALFCTERQSRLSSSSGRCGQESNLISATVGITRTPYGRTFPAEGVVLWWFKCSDWKGGKLRMVRKIYYTL